MTPEELLKAGRPEEALKGLQPRIRDDPANAKSRVFLFQLLSVLGDWKRADTQLQVLSEMDSDSMMLSRIFEPILVCEAIRTDIFAGKRTPIIFGGCHPESPESAPADASARLRFSVASHCSGGLRVRWGI